MFILPFLHFFCLIVYAYLAVFIVIKDPKSPLNRSCAVLMLCFSIWNFSDIFAHNPGLIISKNTAMVLQNISSFGWVGCGSAILVFALVLAGKRNIIRSKYFIMLLFSITAALIYQQLTNGLLIVNARQSYGWEYVWADGVWPYILYIQSFSFTFIAAYLVHLYGRRAKKSFERKQAKIFELSSAVSIIVVMVFDVLFPRLNIHHIPSLGNVFVIFFAAGVVYSIYKYRFLSITPATAAENIISIMEEFLILLNQDGNIISVNRTAMDSLGFENNELEGKSIKALFNNDGLSDSFLKSIHSGETAKNLEASFREKNGKEIPVIFSCSPLKNEDGEIVGTVVIARDITDRKRAEEEREKLRQQLFHTEKMSAIGQLAGGIAHDFNNMLGAIIGFAEMITKKIPPGNSDISRYAERILAVSGRGADLTAKLLAFGRKGKYDVAAVDMHELIDETIKLLEHTIDKRITIRTCLEARSTVVMGDRTQLLNALLNLAINARDFMPGGGEMTFSSDVARVDDPVLMAHPKEVAGKTYLIVSVSDTGVGMENNVKNRLFEPYFTTKPTGKGTGLGLASIYGAVINHGGFIDVQSEPGAGSRFHLYLPLSDTVISSPAHKPVAPEKGTGRILVVDDEDDVREVTSETLKDLGYAVVTCSNGEEAVHYYESRAREIDLVILDIIMPKMGGYDCFMHLKKIKPSIKTIIASGYSMDGEAKRILDQGAMAFIQKPYSMEELAGVISRLLIDKKA